jgi:hypothetical protein
MGEVFASLPLYYRRIGLSCFCWYAVETFHICTILHARRALAVTARWSGTGRHMRVQIDVRT